MSSDILKGGVEMKNVFEYIRNEKEGFILASIPFIASALQILIPAIYRNVAGITFIRASEDFFICVVGLLIYFIYRLIRRNRIKPKLFYIAWAVYFVFSIPYLPWLLGYRTTDIGSLYEALEYTEKYYVIMSRQPENSTGRKEYTLSAEIERREDYVGTNERGEPEHDLNYHINHLYFPNGGYLSFDYDAAYDIPEYTTILVDKETICTDYKGDEYYITLTKNKA